jgi:lysyl-tRNA synthetase class 2
VSDTHDTFEASRVDKLRKIEELGIDPWGGRFDGHQPIGEIRKLPHDAQPPARVRAAGRIVQRRDQGKVVFVDIRDWTGQIQIYLGKKQVGDTAWKLTEELDLGDLLGIDGTLGKTRMGELTIFADQITYLGKSLLPHPDKWGGMQDMEFRLRHRYLDLIYNPETLERTRQRILLVRAIRRYLDDQGYFEVETPTLHSIAGGAAAKPFSTHHNALDIPLFMRIALELPLKRLLVGGIEKVYELGRVFRNEGISPRHNPEFTMLEAYQAYGDYHTMMDLTEEMVVACIQALGGEMKRPYGDAVLDWTPPWQRASYAELFDKHLGVAMSDHAAISKIAEDTGFATAAKHPDVVINHVFEERIQAKLSGPIFVYDYPASICPLTKRKRGRPEIAERFELFVLGMELANAYTELNDPVLQEKTFREQVAGLPAEESMARMDEEFIRALKHGMPPAGGMGIGIDRLTMLLTNTQTIRDVILFPLLRPEKKG